MKATMLFEDGSTCEEVEIFAPMKSGPRHILQTTHRVRCDKPEDLDICMAAQFIRQHQERLSEQLKVFEADFIRNLSKPIPAYCFSITLDGRMPPMSSEEEREAIVECLKGYGAHDLAALIEDGKHLR